MSSSTLGAPNSTGPTPANTSSTPPAMAGNRSKRKKGTDSLNGPFLSPVAHLLLLITLEVPLGKSDRSSTGNADDRVLHAELQVRADRSLRKLGSYSISILWVQKQEGGVESSFRWYDSEGSRRSRAVGKIAHLDGHVENISA
jgi:hypothetical protein